MKTLKLPLNPTTESLLGELGRAVEPLFPVDEPQVSREAMSLYRRLQPGVTTNQRLLNAVPRLASSLLSSLEWAAPKHDTHRQDIERIWAEVQRSLED
jgi:hypothetical protein